MKQVVAFCIHSLSCIALFDSSVFTILFTSHIVGYGSMVYFPVLLSLDFRLLGIMGPPGVLIFCFIFRDLFLCLRKLVVRGMKVHASSDFFFDFENCTVRLFLHWYFVPFCLVF